MGKEKYASQKGKKGRSPSGPAKKERSSMFGPAGDNVGKNTPDLSGCQAKKSHFFIISSKE
jgi:hypothetical protein